MAEKKKITKSSKTTPVDARQRTILELFPTKGNKGSDPVVEEEECVKVSPEPAVVQEPPLSVSAGPSMSSSTKVLKAPPSNPKSRPSNLKLFPIFDKPNKQTPTTTTFSRDAEIDVIEITDDECMTVLPTSTPFTTEAPTESSVGGSSQNPIVLVSPVKPTHRPVESRATPIVVAPPFTIRERKPRPSDFTTPLHRKEGNTSTAPYPTSESQHIRGPQSTFFTPALPFKHRSHRKLDDSEPVSPRRLPNIISHSFDHEENSACHPVDYLSSVTDSDQDSYLNTIPEDDRSHPAVARLLGCTPQQQSTVPSSSPSQQAWVNKWRPTRADQVLGNEQHALYLRDWLRALELQLESSAPPTALAKGAKGKEKVLGDKRGTKRPRIVRAVNKKARKRQRSGMDEDWIVDTSEEEDVIDDDEIGFGNSDEDTEDGEITHHHRLGITRSSTKFDDILTNTTVLSGPPGCGKTAAVYACATELDWEVFEVYPGIGKRSSSSLENLVGDVGKNHLVRRTHQDRDSRNSSRSTMAGYLTNVEIDDFGFVDAPNHPLNNSLETLPDAPSSPARLRQSMVLLEEVDILYKEDANFWPAVVKLIKDCKRPVIMTCTDISLIPTDDLPLQTVLEFDPCPAPLAASYLQSLCLTENFLVNREDILRLYQTTYELNPFDMSHASTIHRSDHLPLPDLRRAINNIQFWPPATELPLDLPEAFEDMIDWNSFAEPVYTIPGDNIPTEERTRRLRLVAMRHTELISFLDSDLTRKASQTTDALALNNDEPSLDDEVGHKMLFQPSASNNAMFGFHHEDKWIAEAAIRLSRGVTKARPQTMAIDSTNTFSNVGLLRARVAHQSQMATILETLIPCPVSCPSVYLDYEPWIRFMVAADDFWEQKPEENMGRLRRITRSSTRYERQITLSALQRELLTLTKLRE